MTQSRIADQDPNALALVALKRGRYFLLVAGVHVAMETDECRDPDIDDRHWTYTSLFVAADRINAATSTSRVVTDEHRKTGRRRADEG